MNLKEKMIGGVNEIRTHEGTSYECLLLLSSAELEQWHPAIGDPAPWAERDAVISTLSRTYLADGSWTLRITAEVGSRENAATVRLNRNSLLRSVQERYDVGSIYFPLEWFGCRTATAGDCTPFCDPVNQTLAGGKLKYMTLDGSWATPGSIVAINAVPLYCAPGTQQILQNADPGSMDFSRSPFIDPIPETFMKQTVTTRLYHCCFYTGKEMAQINGFCGVNGRFGNRCRAADTETGRWLAKSQRLKQVTDLQGNEYTKVERTMIEAPGGLHWSAERNGGLWTW